MNWLQWLCCRPVRMRYALPCLLGMLVSTGVAQGPTPLLNEEPNVAAVHAALDKLRDGEISAALEALGPVADRNPVWGLDVTPPWSSAAGGLHRALSPLSSDEQFEILLKWTMPTATRKTVRVLTVPVPTVAPPAEFARALGERPRPTSFPIAGIGGVRGLFSTGWSLVSAAQDAGKLRRLIKYLEPLAKTEVPHAAELLWLARLVDERVLDGELTLLLDERITRSQERRSVTNGVSPAPVVSLDPQDVLIAAAALERPALRERSASLFQQLLNDTANLTATQVRPLLQRGYATAVIRHRATSAPEELLASKFQHWIPVPSSDVLDGDSAVWFPQEDSLLHLAGCRNDVLLFRYPVTGDFRFECETQSGGAIPTDGGLVYGGFSLFPQQTPSEFTLWDAHGVTRMRRPNHYLRHHTRPTFNTHAIVHNQNLTSFQVNRHSLWDIAHAPTSPWVGLRTLGCRRPLFRHIKFSGNPVIPRQVALLADGDTLGWQARTFGEPQPEWFAIPPQKSPTAITDWESTAGELRGNARPVEDSSSVRQSLISYQRPLLDSESITYEFLHQPGTLEVHPAIGRIAFLLHPEGVRLHWITNGAEEWTSLSADNTIAEPLNRRGPKLLPLKDNEWNRATVHRRGDEFTLSLNDTVVYQRTLASSADHRFGLYRDRQHHGAQVRNVVLSGDWPMTFPDDLRHASTVGTARDRTDADRHALNHLIQDVNFADDVFAVREWTAAMAPQARLDALTAWVLPGPNHAGIRLAGDFSPLDPILETPAGTVAGTQRGGELVSPVFDWLDVARECDALPALRDRLLNLPESQDRDQQRARIALLTMLHLELNDPEAATKTCGELLTLVKTATVVGIEDQWPETLVMFRMLPRFPQFGPLVDLLNYVYSQRTLRWLPANVHVWHTQLARLAMNHRRTVAAEKHPEVAIPLSPEWISGSFVRSQTRGTGCPPAQWDLRGNVLTKISGHQQDFLFYRYPLTGNFEIECDLCNPGQFRNHVLQGGVCVGPHHTTTEYEHGRFGNNPVPAKIEPKLGNHHLWVRYRAVMRDGHLTVFLNGRQVHTETIPAEAPPWVGLRAWGQMLSSARDFRILGTPTIPNAVPLATTPDLLGWYTYNVDEEIGAASWALWRLIKDPDDESSSWVLGREFHEARGNSFESLLNYRRPLTDGERIDYEFFYQPEKREVHPAIDRTAFMLSPEGVREHGITDSRYERTGIDPRNLREHPEYRRGMGPLPLKVEDWNHCQIALVKGHIELRLNDQLVYQRPYNPQRQQTFGLFHYADLTEVRVRNIFLRGDWPQTLPDVSQQLLARSASTAIDADRTHMPAIFEHDFVKEGLSPEYFVVPTSTTESQVRVGPEGVQLHRKTTGSWGGVELSPRFSMTGDFDVELAFTDLRTPSDKDSGLQLSVQFDNEKQVQYRNIRTRTSAGTQELYLSTSLLTIDNNRVYPTLDHFTCEATAGRLRLSRRGSHMHFLFSEADSPYFRLLWTEPATSDPVDASGIKIVGICNGTGSSTVLLKHLQIRAEQLFWHRETTGAGPRALFIMKPDGTGLKQIALPATAGFAVVGSAEFSRDGNMIAMDMSQGSTSTSHLMLCNADGSGLKDIGHGCMPSFSPDGKQLVFSDNGIEIINADGTNRQPLDPSGWGTQWSPDGKWIAYGKAGNVHLMDPKTRTTKALLTGEAAQRYSSIYWNLGWSHDSQTVGFKARRRTDGEDEVAVIDINKPNGLHPLLSKMKGVNPDITFTARNDGVVFGMHNPKVKGSQLHVVYRQKPDEVKVLPNQPTNLRVIDAHWSRDGQWLTFSGQELPPQTAWTTELAASKRPD